MASVYILFSQSISSFYIGSCKDLEIRLEHHRQKVFAKAFTSKADDWVVYFEKSDLDYSLARKIEIHIKKMKSKTYIENLRKYPEILDKLIAKHQLKG